MAPINEPSTKAWIQALLEPGQLLLWAMSYHIKVNLEAIFQRGQILAPILQSKHLRDEAFGRFWLAFSTNREDTLQSQPPPPPTTTTITEIQGSSELIPPILAQATGTVLDVGPGTGTQMPLLRSPAIKAIYGAEPCAGLHSELRARAEAEGLSDKYHILPCSVVAAELGPQLRERGLDRSGRGGVFDTIICVRVLCSVPDLEKTVAELYSLLKPG
ncbi:hypothetical protein BBP40_007175, partial [Aspergillus hancockii]